MVITKYRKKDMFEALSRHYEAEIAKFRVTLDMYMTEPVAVADHSTIVEEIVGLVNKLSSAEDALETLNKYSHRMGCNVDPISHDLYEQE
tara:strand:+ start:59 stop:328 length:270 start_codon:yes stop_codon:yes gene_type:complete